MSGTIDGGAETATDTLTVDNDGNTITVEATGEGRTGDLNGGLAAGFTGSNRSTVVRDRIRSSSTRRRRSMLPVAVVQISSTWILQSQGPSAVARATTPSIWTSAAVPRLLTVALERTR
ncbi:MAG: hypothetical protein U5O39_08465 [Gammaproteobacteria bacterium]|nr:hypothetical protein [Gammaproteobacteria bacterium]